MLDKVFKIFMMVAVTIVIFLQWIVPEEETVNSDPDYVTIEYQCSELDQYSNVPPEVVNECTQRRKSRESNRKS